MSFSFPEQLNIGKKGETLIQEFYGDLIERLDGRKADFRIRATQELFELKTDSYPMTHTPNVFVEKFSDIAKGKIGGPGQAKINGCKYFCYLFINDSRLFWFNTEKLIARTESLVIEKELKPREIKNRAWITTGFLIKREWLKDIYKEVEIVKKEGQPVDLNFLESL